MSKTCKKHGGKVNEKIIHIIAGHFLCLTLSACQQNELEYFAGEAQIPMPQDLLLMSEETKDGYIGYTFKLDTTYSSAKKLWDKYIKLLENNGFEIEDYRILTGGSVPGVKVIYSWDNIDMQQVGYLSIPTESAGIYIFYVFFEE